jgi:hypothetical protein
MLRFLVRLRRWQNWAKAAGFITIFLSVIVCSFLWAISNPPFPSNRPIAQSNHAAANTEQQAADADQRGTKAVPLAVEIIPPKDGTPEAERYEEERQQKAANERGLTVATWVLTFATILLFTIAGVQAAFFWVQLKIMREGMRDATVAAYAARDGAAAAAESARIARSVERPYIAPVRAEVAPAHEDFIPADGVPLKLDMDLKNFGKGLAFLLGYGIAYEVCAPGQEGGKQIIEREQLQGVRLSPDSIFQTTASYGYIRIPMEDYETVHDHNGSKRLFIYGYVRYLDLFGIIRRTSFSYEYAVPLDDRNPLLVLNIRPSLWYDFEESRPERK